MECLLGVFLSMLTFVNFSKCSIPSLRKHDSPFKKNTILFGRNVSCSPDFEKGMFPFKTYTCADIRVDGLRLAYGYYDGMGVSERCQETGGKHEFAELCRRLLFHMEGDVPLHSVYVPKASCEKLAEPRVILTRTEKGYKWKDMGHGNGYVLKLQCSIKQRAGL
ncbi:uncharacterized protein LOC121377038 [Gigantopelta aegis]|uniref:uncharacterized protein LOC121377038 n=1 Tax=Gigantopelta aegis TaxID=1735272 RepID=UPI001B88CD25|nr:uncharacterized protein LOC121377038 [Gigantopelta aegis]